MCICCELVDNIFAPLDRYKLACLPKHTDRVTTSINRINYMHFCNKLWAKSFHKSLLMPKLYKKTFNILLQESEGEKLSIFVSLQFCWALCVVLACAGV